MLFNYLFGNGNLLNQSISTEIISIIQMVLIVVLILNVFLSRRNKNENN